MMKQLLHYHGVMPTFLEHVFPFRAQHRQEDFHIAGFRTQPRIESQDARSSPSALPRSGRQLEFCYNLKAAESTDDPEDPWRMRQFSVYHQFDLEIQRSVWIVIKGNEDARDLIRDRLSAHRNRSTGDTVASALKFSLMIHLEFCKWAAGNWNWYVNALESRIQESRRALSARVGGLNSRTSFQRGVSITTVLTSDTEKTAVEPSSPWLPNGSITSAPTTISGSTQLDGSPKVQQQPQCDADQPSLKVRQKPFSFDDIQQAHTLEEKVNDSLLVLQANAQMVGQIKREYENLLESDSCPDKIKAECASSVKQFARSIEGISTEFETIQYRVKTLLHLTQERKTLVRVQLSMNASTLTFPAIRYPRLPKHVGKSRAGSKVP